jgi:uncharacterized membrane protein
MSAMKRFRPAHAIALVVLVLAAVVGAEQVISGRKAKFERVRPDAQGQVRIDVADLAPNEVRFYRFLNAGNQEVRFFVGRDRQGELLAAFDASDNDFKMNRGFRAHDGWIVNNKCETSIRLGEVNAHPSGCAPVPLRFTAAGDTLITREADVLEGWRYFR